MTTESGFIVIIFFPALAALFLCAAYIIFIYAARIILSMFGEDDL